MKIFVKITTRQFNTEFIKAENVVFLNELFNLKIKKINKIDLKKKFPIRELAH